MSKINDDLFTYEVEIAKVINIPCDLKKEDNSEQQLSHESNDDMEYYPSDARGNDEVELTNEESSDSEDEDEVAKIFRIETNVFNFETPLCRAFKEFNYLLQINPDVLIKNIDGFKTYEEYKDDWIYEIWDDFDNTNRDNKESENEMEYEDEERCEVFDDHERPICYIRRFEMVKYSFRDDEEYVAIKENKCDDLINTSKEAIYAYQDIFCIMDEGWMVSRTE
ncbi:hypothetical protein Tco_0402075 [Tanacetum coccineum]